MPKTILVVDDSTFWKEIINAALATAGYSILLADDGVDALAKITNDTDLVLTDFQMPRMNGLELIVKLRATHPNVHSILMSASEEMNIATAALAGANYFLKKPLNIDQLLNYLESVLH